MVTEGFVEQLYHLMHMVVWVHTPQDHRWMLPIFVLVLVVAPAWLGWQLLRFAWSTLVLEQRRARGRQEFASSSVSPKAKAFPSLENFVLRATMPLQVRVVILSVLALPATYVLLLLPKYIVNYALAEGRPTMDLFGLTALDSEALLFALCACYLLVLTVGSSIKYAANVVHGRISERIVRRIRLAVVRRRRDEPCPRGRSTLAAVAVQECEPIGYFGGSLLLVPLIQGGTLLTSLVFLFAQDVALAFAALIMLPLQIAVLPRLQRRINSGVRERVHVTRAFNVVLAHDMVVVENAEGHHSHFSPTRLQMRQAEALEQVRLKITKLKALFKSLYNYTTNLTPFFFFAVGGYLVLQQRLSLGALVAALAAYREIAPALRELFDFAQNWSDARARYVEVVAVLRLSSTRHPGEIVNLPVSRRDISMNNKEKQVVVALPSKHERSKHVAWLSPVGCLAVLLPLMIIQPAGATDGVSDEAGDITIIDATVDPARRGAYTNVHGRLENRGQQAVTLRSVETPLGERGSFDLHAGRSSIHTGFLGIGGGEQVNFDDERFQLVLGPLQRDLNEGDMVEVTLTFDAFAMRVPIHVHAPQAQQDSPAVHARPVTPAGSSPRP